MSLAVGDRLGRYEIVSPIGKGGMGEVYRAHDTRLGRDVAIKVSAAKFSERFEREARAIAGLNHPHICSLYDVGPDFLVMEHVEGVRLQGPLPLDRALLYASQICDALEAAHRKGIVHRDLKPDNILVGASGVKVLDFGLAKIERAPSAGDATETITLTREGSFMGTLPYMAPEQIEGKETDARADIFAFGVVLYELISGKRPFTGSSQPTLIASILKEQPRPLQGLQPLGSAGLERVIQTCLEKEPDKRWQSAREVRHALEWVSQGASGAPSLGEGKWQVSRCGGNWPKWRADSKEIIFTCREFSSSQRMPIMAAEVSPKGAAFEFGAPQRLFDAPRNNGWDVTPDGQRFLMAVSQVQQAGQIPITVVLDWRAGLKK